MKFLLLFSLLLSSTLRADIINVERHDFAFEYGLSYHTLEGLQRSNNSRGRLTSPLYPYWSGSYALRLSQNFAVRLMYGVQLVRFDEPKGEANLKNEEKILKQYGLELVQRTGNLTKFGIFLLQQEHPLYFAKTPTEFEIIERNFLHAGIHLSASQRRRIGLIWGVGVKPYFLFPTEGGNIVTESGFGGEGYVRLGWIGPLGTTYQIKGFYQTTSAPNAEVTFTHEMLGYAFLVNLTF
jgi:hypothetical protein